MRDSYIKNHIDWLDYTKVLGIFLVIYGHGGLCGDLFKYIYSFHMPMFFIVSGMLYKPLTVRETVCKNWKGLMIPYFLLNLICYVPIFIVSSIKGNLSLDSIISNWGAVLLGLGYNSNGLIPISTPCWFIYALFIAKVILSFVKCSKVWLISLSIFSFLITTVLQYFNIDTLIPIDSALLAIPFICLGYVLRNKIVEIVQTENYTLLSLFILLLVLWVYIVNVNGTIDMNTCKTGNNILLFYTAAIIASLIFFKLCYKVCNRLCLCKIVTGGVNLIAKSTMLYIAFNLIAISYTVKIMEHFFNISKEDYFVGFIIAIIVFIGHVPICMVVIRRFPILIGRRK